MKYALALVAIGLFSLSALARTPADATQRLQQLTSTLELSEEQRTQLESILTQHQAQMQKLMQQMAALRDETDGSIKSVLTEEQQEEFEALKNQHSQRHHRAPPGEF